MERLYIVHQRFSCLRYGNHPLKENPTFPTSRASSRWGWEQRTRGTNPMKYNKDQWTSSFEDAMVKLRPHITMRTK